MSKVHIPEVLAPETGSSPRVSKGSLSKVDGRGTATRATIAAAREAKRSAWDAFRNGEPEEKVAELDQAAMAMPGHTAMVFESLTAMAVLSEFDQPRKKRKKKSKLWKRRK